MSAYAPRHAPPLQHHHPAVLAVAVLAVAVAVAGVVLGLLALSRIPGRAAALSVPLPSSSAPAAHHASPAPAASQRSTAPRAAAPLPYVVQPGDSLWSVAAWYYGTGADWPRIWAANRAVIGPDPDRLLPGERLSFPPSPAGE